MERKQHNRTPGALRCTRYGYLALLAMLVAATAGCDAPQTAEPTRPLPRPVSYLTLKQSNPSRQNRVTGSVESWKKELVGFQVAGRVRFVREPGVNVKGRIVDEDNKVLEAGTLIATLGNERYKLRLGGAQARVSQMQAEARAIKTDIDKTIPSEMRQVQAEYERARKAYERQQRLGTKRYVSQSVVDTAEAKLKEAQARLDQLQARKREQEARLASTRAQSKEAGEAARRAAVDLGDIQLYAPFNGQLSKVHVIPGAYVERGQPVATVQMMDPVKVEIAVSPQTDRQINYNDVIKVYVDGVSQPLDGWVWLKDTVADATTRTFMVTLMVRNRQVDVHPPPELEVKQFVRTRTLWNLEAEGNNGRAPFFTNAETLHQDEEGYFVWQAAGLTIADLAGDFNPVFRVRKVRVIPSDRYLQFLEIFTYRELTDIGGLNPKTDLLAGALPDDVKDGDTVFLSRKQWLLRPGQLVRVDLHQGQMPDGFYVPAQSVVEDAAGHYVYAVKDEANGEQRATRVTVRLGASFGTLQAIEPTTAGQLAAGMKLIVDGTHYVRDGEPINAFEEVELTL